MAITDLLKLAAEIMRQPRAYVRYRYYALWRWRLGIHLSLKTRHPADLPYFWWFEHPEAAQKYDHIIVH